MDFVTEQLDAATSLYLKRLYLLRDEINEGTREGSISQVERRIAAALEFKRMLKDE